LESVKEFIKKNSGVWLSIILLLNFALRLLIYSKTVLFNLSDYKVYLAGIDIIHNEGRISLINGNFLFAISYLGYFAKYLLGNLDYFYILNCFLGTMTTLILANLTNRITGNVISGMVVALIMTFYTEFMVFSSVFYTPVIMLFLLAFFMLQLYLFYTNDLLLYSILNLVSLLITYLTTFLFKPELIFLPLFLILLSLFFIKKDKRFFKRTIFLSTVLIVGTTLFFLTGIFNKPKDQPIANDFIFFGHTDYGGDGGEGSFIYNENKIRYNKALSEWCKKNNIDQPGPQEINRFQRDEVIKFVTHSPFSWIKLQFTKFFRTFGVVPESTSFKVLYSGLLKGNLWLTSIIVVAPVALIIILFILLFNFSFLKRLIKSSTSKPLNSYTLIGNPNTRQNNHFLIIYCLIFFYYLICTIFLGQYQERYRLPLMVVFIIPVLSYFIASFDKKQFFNRIALTIKGVVIVLFITIWLFQAKNAIYNKERLKNAIESVKGVHGID
jgi:hypothetical protein